MIKHKLQNYGFRFEITNICFLSYASPETRAWGDAISSKMKTDRRWSKRGTMDI